MRKVIKEAKEIAAINQMDLYLTEEEMRENDRKHDIEVARQQEKRDMILAFHKNGVSLDIISKSSGLTIDEINKIIKENA